MRIADTEKGRERERAERRDALVEKYSITQYGTTQHCNARMR